MPEWSGPACWPHAQRILDIGSDAMAALEQSAGGGTRTLRIALFATAAAELLPVMLSRTAEDHPGLVLGCREMDVDDVYEAASDDSQLQRGQSGSLGAARRKWTPRPLRSHHVQAGTPIARPQAPFAP